MNPAREALTRAVNRAIEQGAPVYVNQGSEHKMRAHFLKVSRNQYVIVVGTTEVGVCDYLRVRVSGRPWRVYAVNGDVVADVDSLDACATALGF